jgi:hypothetical protein
LRRREAAVPALARTGISDLPLTQRPLQQKMAPVSKVRSQKSEG